MAADSTEAVMTEVISSASNVVPYSVQGEASLTVKSYSQIPKTHASVVTSERFEIGGHQWVLLFYPLGNRPDLGQAVTADQVALLAAAELTAEEQKAEELKAEEQKAEELKAEAATKEAAAPLEAADRTALKAQQQAAATSAQQSLPRMAAMERRRQQYRDEAEQYWSDKHDKAHQEKQKPSKAPFPPTVAEMIAASAAAAAAQAAIKGQLQRVRNIKSFLDNVSVFVVRVGPGKQPQGIQQVFENGSTFPAVHGYHSLTLVNHKKPELSVTLAHKASHPAGPLHIRCNDGPADYDNTQTRWGARKFLKRCILDYPGSGFVQNDTLLIRYHCELLMSEGGALASARRSPCAAEVPRVPPASLSNELGELLRTVCNSDFTICLEHPDYPHEELQAHSLVLAARSPMLRGMLASGMVEAQRRRTVIRDVAPPAVKAMLHFLYTDELPEDIFEEWNQYPAMATHLLAAADAYQLQRLACLCEQRLCRSISVDNAAHLLALAEQHQAQELKRLTMQLLAHNLKQGMQTEGFDLLRSSCPHLMSDIMSQVADIMEPAGSTS